MMQLLPYGKRDKGIMTMTLPNEPELIRFSHLTFGVMSGREDDAPPSQTQVGHMSHSQFSMLKVKEGKMMMCSPLDLTFQCQQPKGVIVAK